MVRKLHRRIDNILRAVSRDEDAFNRFAEAERLGIYLRHGRVYSAMVGQTHTGRMANELLWGGFRPTERPIPPTENPHELPVLNPCCNGVRNLKKE